MDGDLIEKGNEKVLNQGTIQLYGTESLCFDKNDFMQNEFNVDTFVQVHQASGSGGLEILRDDLGIFLKILRSAMIDLINRDYADFVNLSTNLTGLDRLIDSLKTPLGQLREEVLSVEQFLSEAIEAVSADLEQRHAINKSISLLECLSHISYRLDRLEAHLKSKDTEPAATGTGAGEGGNDLVDRLASGINHLNFLVGHCKGAALLDNLHPRVERVCKFVESELERNLREGIQSRNSALLARTLRTYASLGSIDSAHQQVRDILKSNLKEVVSESALRSNPRGLKGLYDNVLKCINKICEPLLSVSVGKGSDVVRGYSFLESSAWPEVVHSLETRTPNIFSSGNPSVFHERYLQSMEFLTAFEELIVEEDRLKVFRKSESLQRFLEQWNLPVYFQIRYQEIGQVLESSFCDANDGLLMSPSSSDFKLLSTRSVWESLLKCFNSEIFLLPLLHRFWKLSLLILSRHRSFVTTSIAGLSGKLKKCKDVGKHSQSVSPDEADSTKETLPQEMRLLVYLSQDIETLRPRIKTFYSAVIGPRVRCLAENKAQVIQDTLEFLCDEHFKLKEPLNKAFEEYLSSSVIGILKQVSDTPRMYRRTNKALPTSPQTHVINAMVLPSAFVELTRGHLKQEEVASILEKVFSTVAEEYRVLIYDVLSSVHKMEESLKRLKKARERGSAAGNSQTATVTDDDKIRSQLYQDVIYIGDQVSNVGIESSSIKAFSELLEMVETAKQGNFIP